MRIVRPVPLRRLALLGALAALTASACANPATSSAAAQPTTSPSPKMGGCRDLYLYAANDDATQVVIVDVDAKSVGMHRGQKKTFDLTSPPKGVHVWLDVYLQPAHVENVHCTSNPTEAQMAERYGATSGGLTVEVAADGTVTASVEGAKFALEGRPVIEVAGRRFDRIRLAGN